jgi:glycosyltransferase involved in cell wall biosynthesis
MEGGVDLLADAGFSGDEMTALIEQAMLNPAPLDTGSGGAGSDGDGDGGGDMLPAAVAREAAGLGIRAELLKLGVPLDRWPPAAPRARSAGEPLRLLSVGSLNRVKDHRTLLHALAHLRVSGVDARLACVGEDLQGGTLERLAAELGIAPAVRFHGFVPHAELRCYFDNAHVLVVSSRYEGDPIAALEGAVAGLAVAGTAVGHLQEWAPRAAVMCEPGDAEGLAAVLGRIAADDTERLRLAHAALAIALHHDADRAAARVLEHYRGMARV